MPPVLLKTQAKSSFTVSGATEPKESVAASRKLKLARLSTQSNIPQLCLTNIKQQAKHI